MVKETYLKPREAAEYLSSSTSTLAKRRMKRLGPNYVRLGRAIRYRQSDLDAWMAANAAIPTNGAEWRFGEHNTDVA